MRFFQSVHLVIHLPLETLNSIIRASSPILVELTIFVSQMTLLTLLTFLFGSCSFGKIGKNSLWMEKFWSYWSSDRKGVTLFISQLVPILLLLGAVFVIIFKMFYVKICLNSMLLLQVLNFVSDSKGWNWWIYPSS